MDEFDETIIKFKWKNYLRKIIKFKSRLAN